jgi:hypothetical protein
MAVTSSDQNGTDRHEPAARSPKTAPRGAPAPAVAVAVAWGVPFALVLTVLLVRNAFLFSTPEYEDADMGANSILIEQARRFTLLVGNYSREGFNHPGPAFLYVQSWGESVFYDALGVVPTPWNGQLIALYALNALFAGSVVATVCGWSWSARGAAVTLAVVLGFGALHPSMFSSDWMPYEYVPAYFAFIVAIASVAAGQSRDSWLAALSGWFLIHGHACFLLFVPVLAAAPLSAAGWSRWKGKTQAQARGKERAVFSPPPPHVWVPVAAISAVFALPIVIELAAHWPGNFGKYFAYSSSARSGGHGAAQVASYVLWFWWPHAGAWAVLSALVAAAALLTWRAPGGPLRRFGWSLLAVDALSTATFAAYTAVGVDALNQYYIGSCYWSAPVIAILVIALSATELLAAASSSRSRVRAAPRGRVLAAPRGRVLAVTAIAAAAATAACVAFAVAPQTRLDTDRADPANPATGPVTDPSLPAGVAAIAAIAAGRPAILSFAHDAWPAITGVLVQAERTGVPACVARPSWEFMMTGQFICTPAERADGRGFHVWGPGQMPRGAALVYRLRRGVVTAGGK